MTSGVEILQGQHEVRNRNRVMPDRLKPAKAEHNPLRAPSVKHCFLITSTLANLHNIRIPPNINCGDIYARSAVAAAWTLAEQLNRKKLTRVPRDARASFMPILDPDYDKPNHAGAMKFEVLLGKQRFIGVFENPTPAGDEGLKYEGIPLHICAANVTPTGDTRTNLIRQDLVASDGALSYQGIRFFKLLSEEFSRN